MRASRAQAKDKHTWEEEEAGGKPGSTGASARAGKRISSLKGFEGLRALLVLGFVCIAWNDDAEGSFIPAAGLRCGSPSLQGAVCGRWDLLEVNAMRAWGVSPVQAPQSCSLPLRGTAMRPRWMPAPYGSQAAP